MSAGLNGDISDSLSWDVAATYMEQNATREGRDTVVNRYQLALRGLGGPNCNVAANTPGAERLLLVQPVQQCHSRAIAITGAAELAVQRGAVQRQSAS